MKIAVLEGASLMRLEVDPVAPLGVGRLLGGGRPLELGFLDYAWVRGAPWLGSHVDGGRRLAGHELILAQVEVVGSVLVQQCNLSGCGPSQTLQSCHARGVWNCY